MTAHWGIEDPAAVVASDQEGGDGQAQAFRIAYLSMQRRIRLFLALPLDSIDEMSLQRKIRHIGQTADESASVD